MAEKQTNFDNLLNVIQLDDNCTTDKFGTARRYRVTYRGLAEDMGVRLERG